VNKSQELGPGFIRKGVVGDWRNHLSRDQSRALEEKAARILRGSDLSFVYDL